MLIVSSLLTVLLWLPQANAVVDVNLIGFIDDNRSISRHVTSFIDTLSPEIPIKLFKTRACSLFNQSDYVKDIAATAIDLSEKAHIKSFIKLNKPLQGITIYIEPLIKKQTFINYAMLPNQSTIKIAHCVHESTQILATWVDLLNNNFDALVVPDDWLVSVYKKSGVNIPIFVLPLVLDLDSLLQKDIKSKPGTPFTFGYAGAFTERKNHSKLIEAFYKEFGNNPNVLLKLHSRFKSILKENLASVTSKLNVDNIFIDEKCFNRQEYEAFIASLDCYVSPSLAEGFSIIPREALAASIPCILSNNTAQKTICRSGYVYVMPSNIRVRGMTETRYYWNSGDRFDCSVDDLRKAMRSVYENYQHYQALALEGRTWAQQFSKQAQKDNYQTLIAPRKIVLGEHDGIAHGTLTTTSRKLFEKYMLLEKSR